MSNHGSILYFSNNKLQSKQLKILFWGQSQDSTKCDFGGNQSILTNLLLSCLIKRYILNPFDSICIQYIMAEDNNTGFVF